MLSFHHKDNSTGQSYIALSRIYSIDYVAFKSVFSYDRFPSQLSAGIKDRIADTSNRKNH